MTLLHSLVVAIAAVSQTATATACPGPAPASNPQTANGVAFKVLQNGLAKPRGVVMDSEGNLLVVEAMSKGVTRVVLDDAEGLNVCISSSAQLIDDSTLNHGIALSGDGKTLFVSSDSNVYAYPYDASKGTVGNAKHLIKGMKQTGHISRTLLVPRHNPDLLLVSRGSNSNIDKETAEISSGRSQLRIFKIPDLVQDGAEAVEYTAGAVLGWGLRNSVGVADDPTNGHIWTVENSIDKMEREGADIHNSNPGEELNFHGLPNDTSSAQYGCNFGYPGCVAIYDPSNVKSFSVQGGPKVGLQMTGDHIAGYTDDWCRENAAAPYLTFGSHLAPLDIKFLNDGSAALIAIHGSWNRQPPNGYRLSRVSFADGKPMAKADSDDAEEKLLWNADNAECPVKCFRPAGLWLDGKGRTFITSDSSGELFVVTGASNNGLKAKVNGEVKTSGAERRMRQQFGSWLWGELSYAGPKFNDPNVTKGVLNLAIKDLGRFRPSSTSSQHTGGSSKHQQVEMESSEEGPAAKRRRLSSSTPGACTSSQARKEKYSTILRTRLLPHVIRAVKTLPPTGLKLPEIAVNSATILAKRFLSNIGNDTSLLIPDDAATTEQQALETVRQLSLLPEYHVAESIHDGPVVIKQEQKASPSIDQIPPVSANNAVSEVSEVSQTPAVSVASVLPARPTPFGLTPAQPLSRSSRPLRKPYKPRVRRETSPRPDPLWTQLALRPYLSARDRDALQQGSQIALAKAEHLRNGPAVFHVDFSAAEIAIMIGEMARRAKRDIPRTSVALRQLCLKFPVPKLVEGKLPGRTEEDVRHFCSDLMANKAADPRSARILSLHREATQDNKDHQRESQLSSLLFARELAGNASMGRTRRYINFQSTFKQIREDALENAIGQFAEFTNCAGDISTMTWVPHQNIICGTTTHSDAHNQQYNKAGNLLLCSTSKADLRAFPDHRIPRPLITKGENSSEAMRESQEPWIYSSVVSSDYDKVHGFAYTSSFDKTIKVWKVDEDGGSMQAVATFEHNGNVNFVAVAKDGSGRVAAAADTTSEAIRIYTMDPNNIAESSYYSISSSRNDADGSDKWAYCPATVQWGTAPGSQHLLLVGYSPRSFSGDEQDIPNDKQQTGEIMLWDARDRRKIPVLTATTANVFEVAWHPTLCGFVVGTSPVGLHIDQGVRTQVHVFRQDWGQHIDGAYSEYRKLDCFASDINELSIVSNSMQSAYITAACTDGKVYVWDMALGDKPIHVLKHGSPLEEVLQPEEREREDTGVKFTAWGSDLSRLYTGSSDGVVKVWNIRNRRRPFVRDLLRAPGPISCGSFSPDRSKLAIGDATGRLFLFSTTKEQQFEERFSRVHQTTKQLVHRSRPFTPHPDPPPPPPVHDLDAMLLDGTNNDDDDTTDSATYARRRYLDTQQLALHRNPVIGAVQGPQYAASGHFLRDAHLDDDPTAPLLTQYERLQLESRHSVLGSAACLRRRSLRRLAPAPAVVDDATEQQHRGNVARDFDVAALDKADWDELVREGALLDIGDSGEDWGFAYEDSPAVYDDANACDMESGS